MSSSDSPSPVETPLVSREEKPEEGAPCANCGADLHGAYCATCGQRNEPLRQPVGRFLKAALIEFLGVDGRLWTSLWVLLFHPGQLTNAYLAGKRIRFIRPLRFYLIASLVFFFLLSVIDPVGQVNFGGEAASADTTVQVADYRTMLQARLDENADRLASQVSVVDSLERQFLVDSLAFATVDSLTADSTADVLENAFDDALDDRDDERRDLWRLRQRISQENRQLQWINSQIAVAPPDSLVRPPDLESAAALLFEDAPGNRININLPAWWPQSAAVRQMQAARTDAEFNAAFAAFIRDTLRRLPTVMFIVLPVFAFLLKLLYLRRDWYYSEHLIFGLHTHAVAFITFTIMLLVSWASGGANWAGIFGFVLLLLIPVYFFVAQKQVYGQGWFKTAFKAWLLGWMYSLVLSIGLVLALVLAASQ